MNAACPYQHHFLRRAIGQVTGVVTVDGARCELDVGHDGPHVSGALRWWAPPVVVVGGRAP